MALKTNKKFAAAAVLAAATAVTAAAGLTLRQSVKVYADGGQAYTSLCANYSGKSSEAFHNGLDGFQLGKQHIKVKCNGQEAEAGGLCDAADETDGGSAFTADMQNGKLTLDLELGEELDGAVLRYSLIPWATRRSIFRATEILFHRLRQPRRRQPTKLR